MRFTLALPGLLLPCALAGQSLELRLDPSSAQVGDVVIVTATVRLPPGMEALDPAPKPLLPLPKGVRILSSDTLKPVGEELHQARIRMAFYRVGAQPVPTLSLLFRPAAGAPPDTLVHLPVSVTITPLLPAAGNPQVKDIRGPRALGGPGWLPLATLIAAAAAGIWWRRRRAGRPTPASAPLPEPEVEAGAFARALARLDRMETELTADGEGVEPGYEALAALLRETLVASGALPHLGLTTPEVTSALPDPLRGAAGVERCASLLREADLVKFALLRPDLSTLRGSLDRTRGLLRDWHAATAGERKAAA